MPASFSEYEESDLLVLARQGDAEAFAELIRRTRPGSMKAAVAILKNPDDAEDQLQTAYFKAWRELPNFREDARFSTWLRRIVINECLMALRSRRRAALVSLEPEEDEARPALQLADVRPGPEETLGEREVKEVLLGEMQRVPPLLRGALMLAELERRSMAEIAEQFGISVEAAKSRLHRARRELRKRMDRHTGKLGAATLLA